MKKSLFVSTVLMVLFLTGCFGGTSLPRIDPELFINDVLQVGSTQTFTVGQELVVKETLRIGNPGESGIPVNLNTIQNYDLYGIVGVTPIGDPDYIPPECSIYLYWDDILSSIPNVECHNPSNYVLPIGIDQIEPPMAENRSPTLSSVTYNETNHVITTTTRVKLTKIGTYRIGFGFLLRAKSLPSSDWKNLRVFHGTGANVIVK